MADVFVNEKFVGNVDNAAEFVEKFKQERRKGRIPHIVNIFHNKEVDEIYVDFSRGRARRPLIVVENGASKVTKQHLQQLEKNEITWKDLVNQGVIEYLDTAEEENALVALREEDITSEHTHVEISPATILGLVTALVPFANYGQSARLNRGSKGQKQALGMYTSNYLLRMDTDVSVLHSPQKPIVKTFMHDILEFEKHPSGQNMVIALMSYQGQNMQDAIILNKGSIDRGLARSTYFRPYAVEELGILAA